MATAAARPLVTVQGLDNDMTTDQSPTVVLPNVMTAPVCPDIVSFVHAQISNNSRQPYAVSTKAGHQTSAESWGNRTRRLAYPPRPRRRNSPRRTSCLR
ncbi:hypothetical protein F2Q69_00003146 [Brassica cretica]|uniref:Uncharacterized protein n=1 Tax=Brassica cretica TaxID=69181 RepID=A0A8S9PEZ3_BRACR|nr:hypothetical protein F2Q69_00003146 [Brassica cretica]